MKISKCLAAPVLVAVFLVSSVANAALIVDVTGTPGSGETTWTFSGSYTTTASATEDQITVAPSTFSTSSTRLVLGLNYFQHSSNEASVPLALDTVFNDTSVALTSSAFITGSLSGVHLLNGLYIDADNGLDDDFAWFAGGAFSAGEIISFTGTGVMFRDITEFGDPGLTSGSSFVFSSTSEVTPLTVTFSAVPVPAAVWLFGSGLLGLIGVVRRKKA